VLKVWPFELTGGLALDYWVTPRIATGTNPMGFPPWSRGPLLHTGEKRHHFPLVDHGVQTPWSI